VSRKKPLDFRDGVSYAFLMPRTKMPQAARDYFVKMGRKGGLLGGKIRAERMTEEERRESARKAVQARWAKAKQG
jgi:hypothetical protein